MKLTFRLRFRTNYGQSLYVCGNHPELGADRIEDALPLRYVNEDLWEATAILPQENPSKLAIGYHYILREADGSRVEDWRGGRSIRSEELNRAELLVLDSWNDAGAVENAFYTESFQQVLLRPNLAEVHPAPQLRSTHTFRVKAPLLERGQTLCIVGNTAAVGNWNTKSPRLLTRRSGDEYLTVDLHLGNTLFPVAYKYGVYDVEHARFVRYEDGENRVLQDSIASGKHTIANDGFARLAANTWKGAGVAIPVFSLRTEKSFGVGEFLDLKPLAEWCAKAGLKLIQILPVNDTMATHTWADSYPYAAISAFALHPIYLNLNRIATAANQPLLARLESERQRLNALSELNYEAVMKAKLDFLRRIYPSQSKETFAGAAYQEFFAKNRHWLKPYAAFCCLRDRFGTADFSRWPAHRTYRADEIEQLSASDEKAQSEIAFNYFVQFHLHLQLKEAAEFAHEHGVIVKGDIAIGVFRHSADVWQQPELFNTDMQAGAPPDAFAAKGQNWGFPTYNWPRMKQDGFAWWRQRFEQMSAYFDAFRIDHILGFFRIWSSPAHAVEGILGYFVPAIPVHASEFASRGIALDRERLLNPYITDDVLREMFGDVAAEVKREFLEVGASGTYALKPDFASQRHVERHFSALEQNERNRRIKDGLFDLISNVILFEVADSQGQEFHFRFGMDATSSFRRFDSLTQAKLRELYLDYFFRRQDAFWMKQAMEKLPALKRVTNMLICGEDLGMVPACVPEVMKRLGLLSLEIQRMPKQMNREFSHPGEAPYLSVVTPSTHDMSTVRGWWEEDSKLTQHFYNEELGMPGLAPETCAGAINEAIIRQHLASPAMWSIFQLQDWLGMDETLRRKDVSAERINVPADSRNQWRYRMHLTVEKLQKARDFNERVRRLVHAAGR